MSPSKALKNVQAYLAKPVNTKARKSNTPSPVNTRGNAGYKKVWHAKGYYRKVIKKNGKWVPDPNNKKWYVKSGENFHAPQAINYWSLSH